MRRRAAQLRPTPAAGTDNHTPSSDVRWRRAQARVPPHDRQPRDRGGVHGAPAPAEGLARLPRRGAGRRGAGGALAPPPGRGRDGDPVRDARPARLPRPRPGVPLRAPRGRLPRPLRDRGRGGVRRPRRPDGRRGPRARRDALRPGRERTALPARALGGRGEPAARRDAAGRRLDDGRRRDRRGDRRHGRARARPQPGAARLRDRPAGARRRHGRRAAPAPARGRHPPRAARGPARRGQPGDPRAGDHPAGRRLRAPVPRPAAGRAVERADLAHDRDGRRGADARGRRRPAAHRPRRRPRATRAPPADREGAPRGVAGGRLVPRLHPEPQPLRRPPGGAADRVGEPAPRLGVPRVRRRRAGGPGPLRARLDVRPHDRPAPAARRPLRRRGVRRALRRRGDPGVGARGVPGAARR